MTIVILLLTHLPLLVRFPEMCYLQFIDDIAFKWKWIQLSFFGWRVVTPCQDKCCLLPVGLRCLVWATIICVGFLPIFTSRLIKPPGYNCRTMVCSCPVFITSHWGRVGCRGWGDTENGVGIWADFYHPDALALTPIIVAHDPQFMLLTLCSQEPNLGSWWDC